MIPGEIIPADAAEPLVANKGLPVCTLTVANSADRPVQIGSHFHFYEVNEGLVFDRQSAWGMRLDIPAGTAVRFEPGDEKEGQLVAFAGKREVFGLNGKVNGTLER